MKISYVMGSLNPGGAETQTANAVWRLREMGHDVHVVLPNGAGEMPGNLLPVMQQRGVPMISTVMKRDKTAAMTEVFKKLRPDAVNSNGYPMTLHGSLAAKAAGVPVRVIWQGNTGHAREEFPQDERFETDGNRAAMAYVGNSQAVVRALGQQPGIDPARCRMIRNAVTIPAINAKMRLRARAHWQAAKDDIVIGYLANFRPDGLKNQMMLVRAAALVVAAEPRVLFVMPGYPSAYMEEVREEVRRLKLGQHVFLPGRITDLDLLAGWDIAVNCSHTEGFSNAVQECMAYGLPVVATDVGGNSESGAMMVPDDDHEALAQVLTALIRKPQERRVLGAAHREKMIEYCSWDAILPQWINLYSELLEAAHA